MAENNILCIQIHCCYSVSQSWISLCDAMDCSTPGLPVLHQLPEFTQIHVQWVGDAIQPSHLLSSPSPPALNLSQLQGIFQWVSSSHQVAKVLKLSFSISPSNEHTGLISLGWTDWTSLQSEGLSRVFPNTTVQKHWFFVVKPFYGPPLISIHDYWKNHSFDYMKLFWQSNVSAF